MSPKKSLNLARGKGRASDGEEERHHRPRHRRALGHKSHRLEGCSTMKKKSRVTEKVKKTTNKLEADNNKSLYICSLEHHEGDWVAYVVRAIKVSDLLSSDDELQLRQVAYKAGVDLPGSVGCGVFGSQILFAGGLKPSVPGGTGAVNAEESVWHRGVYAFETDPNKREHDDDIITKMDASLLGAKFYPLTVELGGKLYSLSRRRVADPPQFEVFDPKVGRWLAVPQPPFFQVNSPYYFHAPFAYAIAGTKMFVSHEKCPVFCFDVAHPNGEWRLVPTMCRGGPFPFFDEALVLDLPADDRKKIMFTYSAYRSTRLGVYLMSLDDNKESITQIGCLKPPMWPYELGAAAASDLVHLGGQKACLVITHFNLPQDKGPIYEPGTHKTRGVAIPFQFEFDITKDKRNCFTLQFMPPRIFKYRTNPSVYPEPERSFARPRFKRLQLLPSELFSYRRCLSLMKQYLELFVEDIDHHVYLRSEGISAWRPAFLYDLRVQMCDNIVRKDSASLKRVLICVDYIFPYKVIGDEQENPLFTLTAIKSRRFSFPVRFRCITVKLLEVDGKSEGFKNMVALIFLINDRSRLAHRRGTSRRSPQLGWPGFLMPSGVQCTVPFLPHGICKDTFYTEKWCREGNFVWYQACR